MTAGHKHRTIGTRRGSVLHRVLTYPLVRTTDRHRAEVSRFTWRDEQGGIDAIRHVFPHASGRARPRPPTPDVFTLSLLGVLHGAFGLTLRIRVPAEERRA